MVPIDQSILCQGHSFGAVLTDSRRYRLFSKEELLDYDLTQDAIKALLKSLLPVPSYSGEKRDLGRLMSP